MRIGRREALDLLSKWAEERTLLECSIELRLVAARLRARISKVNDLVRLMSDDLASELAFNLEDVIDFGYGDTRGHEAADEFDGVLVVFFRFGNEGAPSDRISLAEVIK